MIPIGLAIIKEAHDLQEANKQIQKFEKSLVLAIGYAGTIGGLGTLIGTPLIILKGQYMHFGHEISFWMIVGIPTVIVLLGITWLYLRYVAFRHDLKYLPGGQTLIKQKLDELGNMKYEEKVQTIFVLASLLWITREFLLKNGKLRHPLQIKIVFRHDLKYLPGGQTLIKQKLDELGNMKYEER